MKTCFLFLETVVLLLWEMLTNKQLNRLTQEVDNDCTDYFYVPQLQLTNDSLVSANSPSATIVAIEFQSDIHSINLQPTLAKA